MSKMGRPPTVKDQYDPKYCEMLIEHMSKGLSYESFSAKIGTYRQILYRWEQEFPDFCDAKKRAQELCQYWWELAGNNGLYSVVEHGEEGSTTVEKKINNAIWIFSMKARFGWRDTTPTQPILPSSEPQREVLELEDKKKLLEQAEKEIEKLREEINAISDSE